MSEDDQPQPPPNRRGCLLGIVAVLLSFVLLASALGVGWWSGALPRWAVLQGLQRMLPAHIELGPVHLGRTFKMDSLVLGQPQYTDQLPHTLRLEKLHMDYDLRPTDGRYIDRIAIDSLQLQGDSSVSPTTYQWLQDFLAQPGGDTLAFVPRSIEIAHLDAGFRAPDFLLGVQGLRVTGQFPGLSKSTFHFTGEKIQFIEQSPYSGLPLEETTEPDAPAEDTTETDPQAEDTAEPDPPAEEATEAAPPAEITTEPDPPALPDSQNPAQWPPAQHFEGQADWQLTLDGNQVTTGGEIRIPGAATLQGDATFRRLANGVAGALDIEAFSLEQPVWGAFLSAALPIPLGFTALSLETLAASGGVYSDAFALDHITAAGAAPGFRLGPPDAPYLVGDLHFSGAGESAAGRAGFQGEIGLDGAPPFTVSFAGMPDEWQLDLRTDPWNRAQILAATPSAQEGLESAQTLDQLGGAAMIRFAEEAFHFEAQLDAITGTEKAAIQAKGRMNPETEAIEAELSLELLRGKASGALAWSSIESFDAPLALSNVEPHAWLTALMANNALASLRAPATGTLRLQGMEKAVQFDAKLQLEDFALSGRSLSDGHKPSLDVVGSYDLEAATAQGAHLNVALGEILDARLTSWRAEPAAGRFRANLKGEVDLGYVSRTFGPAGLWGDLALDGPFTWSPTGFEWQGTAHADSFGYDDWATPYNVPTQAQATLRVNTDGHVQLAPFSLQIGEQLQGQTEALNIRPTDKGITLELSNTTVESTLQPMVSRGLFAAGDGQIQLNIPTLRYINDAWNGDLNLNFNAASLTLPSAIAQLEDTVLTGDFGYDDGLSGIGRLIIGALNIGGTRLTTLATAVRGDGTALHFQELESGLFNGQIEGTARVEVLDPTFPLHLDAKVTNLNLATFTEEFEPPDTELTGLVSGEIEIALNLLGLEDLRVRLEAPDGITLNRTMVELILLSQQMGDFTAGGTLTNVVQRVIGTDVQRPFDSASLHLDFMEGRIVGTVYLRSRALNLTVDIKADPGAIAEALRIRTN